jgi:hypothetical protein
MTRGRDALVDLLYGRDTFRRHLSSGREAAATPIDFFYEYSLNAVTDNGMAFTGTFSFNPGTNTFLNAVGKWAFQLQGATRE